MKFDDKYDIARPYTACFVILRNRNKIAMVLRRNTSWMDGYYGLPAGKGEWHESFTQIAIREAKEEAGVDIHPDHIRMVHLSHRRTALNDLFMDWVDVYYEADKWDGEPHNAEPDKASRLDWIDINNLPEKVVPHQLEVLKAIAKGKQYTEFGWD